MADEDLLLKLRQTMIKPIGEASDIKTFLKVKPDEEMNNMADEMDIECDCGHIVPESEIYCDNAGELYCSECWGDMHNANAI